MRRYGAGKDVFEAGCGTGLLLREAAGGRALRGRPGSVARDAGARPGARADRRAGLADRRAAAVGVVRPRLQHEGAGARSAHRTRGRGAGPPGAARADTCCSSSTTRCRCATWPSGWAAPGASPTTAPTRATSTRASTRSPRARSLPSRRTSSWSRVRGVRVVTPSSHVFAWPPLGKLFAWAERAACDAPLLRNLGGFLILVARKSDPTR